MSRFFCLNQSEKDSLKWFIKFIKVIQGWHIFDESQSKKISKALRLLKQISE